MVGFNERYFKRFVPTPITKTEKFKLFFRRMKASTNVMTKTDNVEISCTIYYKTLGEKMFTLNKEYYIHAKFPDIRIIMDENRA